MHPKNNNNGAHREPAQPRDPYLSGLTAENRRTAGVYSEAMHAVMDEVSGTATSRRAQLYNRLHN